MKEMRVWFGDNFRSLGRVIPLLKEKNELYQVCNFFVSQFIEVETQIKTSSSINKEILNLKKLIDKVKPDIFEGKHRLQLYNKAIYLLLSYYNPKRFN